MRRLVLTASTLALLTNPALADITATEIWDEWVAQEASAGGELKAANQTYSGGVLTLSDVKETYDFGDSDVLIELGEIVMREQSDGSVDYSFSDLIKITISIEDTRETIVIPIEIAMENYVGSVSGEELRHYVASSGAMQLSTDINIDDFQLSLKAQAASTKTDYKMSAGTEGPWELEGGMDFVSTATTAAGSDAESTFTYNASSEGSGLFFDGTLMPSPEGDMSVALTDAPFRARFNIGPGESSSQTITEAGTTMSSGTSKGSVIEAAFEDAYMSFNSRIEGFDGRVTDPNIPFPIELSSGPWALGASVPVRPAAEAQPMGFSLSIEQLALAEAIWSLFDPTAQLPRDPIDLTIDLDGQGRALVDLMDDNLDNVDEPPFEIDSLKITSLLARAAGALLTGDGALTFDNTSGRFGEGVPQPIGTINLNLEGGYALMDKLVAIGLLPAQQAQVAKMTVGMFTTATGEDALSSKIEFTERGGVLINGLPMPF